MSIKGKVIVLTGCSSGVGKAMALTLAKESASLVLAARRGDALEELANECKEIGAEAIAVTTDVKEISQVYLLTQKALETFGKIDVWINNAGVLAVGAFDKILSLVNEDVVRTNLMGYIHGAQAVLPVFKRQRHGILINNISVGGWFPTPYMAAYSASKFGLRGFFEALKGELKPYSQIHVCDLYPGFLDTTGMQHSANYTGKQLTPAPPLYSPYKVAQAAVKLIKRPKSKMVIGAFPIILKIAYSLAPTLTRNIAGALFRRYLNMAPGTTITKGNILHPVPYGTGVEGAWRMNMITKKQKRSTLIAAAGIAGLILLSRRLS